MKKLLITMAMVLMAGTVWAADYTLVTKDEEVSSVDQVQVKKTATQQIETTYTLSKLDAQIAELDRQIAAMQAGIDERNAEKAELQAIRTTVETEAKKVKLAAEEAQVESK